MATPLHLTKTSLAIIAKPEFPKLLQTNVSANAQEATMIRSAAAAAREQLQRVQAELEQAEPYVEQLRAQRDELKEYTQRYNCVASGIRNLPVEILVVIFLLLRPNPNDEPSSFDVRGWPWSLARVCSRWRSVIASTPQFWGKIISTMPPIPRLDTRKSIRHSLHVNWIYDLTKTILSRTNDLPLSVTFSPIFMQEHSRSLSLLLSTSSRWREATLNFHPVISSEVPEHFSDIENKLDALETLKVVVDHDYQPIQPKTLNTIFHAAPKLHTAKLVGPSALVYFQLPWHQLTTLTYEDLEVLPHALDIFHHMPQLINLSIRGTFGPLDDFEPILLPNLSSLSLTIDANYVQVWTLPGLQYLIINIDYEEPIPDFLDLTTITAMLRRSSCPLNTLSIQAPALSNDNDNNEIIPLLLAVPTLKTLRLSRLRVVSRNLLRALTLDTSRGTSNIAPSLLHVVLHALQEGEPGVISALLAFLESRRKAGSDFGLKRALITVPPELFTIPSQANRLMRLEDSGLQVQILSAGSFLEDYYPNGQA
ncbi:hypothetical protein HGRIS_013163 [Hohenbuehelia grisea]|uniref:F-box domain-containing protein n=1 Tax=Hohenbuehelia grisea TaxID=104357 RepID=A0ABR3IUU2_9AGAR